MGEYIDLDLSLKDTAICVRRDGERVWRGKCASDPAVIAGVLRKHAPEVQRIVVDTGPLSIWFFHALKRAWHCFVRLLGTDEHVLPMLT